jgi:hypothetical protein
VCIGCVYRVCVYRGGAYRFAPLRVLLADVPSHHGRDRRWWRGWAHQMLVLAFQRHLHRAIRDVWHSPGGAVSRLASFISKLLLVPAISANHWHNIIIINT